MVTARILQEPPEAGQPLLIRKQLPFFIALIIHGSEFEQGKRPTMQPWAHLPEKHRGPHPTADQKRQNTIERREENQRRDSEAPRAGARGIR